MNIFLMYISINILRYKLKKIYNLFILFDNFKIMFILKNIILETKILQLNYKL